MPNIEQEEQHASRWQVAGICAVLIAITFAVFGQTVGDSFINLDDPDYVIENAHVNHGITLDNVLWAFTHFYSSNWHPLTWISHMLDCQFYGLNPGGHHLTNVILHTGTVVALFLVLWRMTGALWRCAFVAAVFAIHPLRAESVAWISERKDVLSGLFFMLTLGSYALYVQRNRAKGLYGLVVLFFVLGLLSKPMLVTLPLVLLVLDYWPLQRKASPVNLVLEKLPLFALSAASCLLTVFAQHKAMRSTEVFPPLHRIINSVLACADYLVQIVYPVNLVAFYPFPRHGLSLAEAAMAAALMGIVTYEAWNNRKTRPWLLVGWIWYFVMLFPVIGIVQVGSQAHADRYTYLPQIGIYIAVTWLAAEWVAKRHLPKAIPGAVMGVIVAVLMVGGWKQTAYWKNSETLWNHVLACMPDNRVAVLNLGHHLFMKGRLVEAIALFQKALETDPDYADYHNNLGKAYEDKGRTAEAIVEYGKAVSERAAFPEAEYNLGKALVKQGNEDQAITHFQNALVLQPDFAPAHMSLGNALFQRGRITEAAEQFQQMTKFRPKDAGAHLNLGLCFFQMGRMKEASEQYQQALALAPSDPGVQSNFAWLLATCPEAALRDGTQALDLARRANGLTGGNNVVVLHTLAAAFAEAGRYSEAVETGKHALSLAQARAQSGLARQLQSEIELYMAGRPFHASEPTKQ